MTLEGKVALVAGATRGAGRGLARELAAAGAAGVRLVLAAGHPLLVVVPDLTLDREELLDVHSILPVGPDVPS